LKQVQLVAHLHTQGPIELPEWLVEQEDGGSLHQCTSQRHALLLAAGKFARASAKDCLQAQGLSYLLQSRVHVRAPNFRPTAHPQAEKEVIADAKVRVKGWPLEDHGHITAVGSVGRYSFASDADGACTEGLQASDEAKGRSLAAT
jgi:hypothetical protein